METKTAFAALPLIISLSGPLCAEPLSDAERAYALDTLIELKAEHAPSAHALCAAWNGLVAVKMNGAVARIIGNEALRHKNIAAEVVGEELALGGIEAVMNHAKDSYNSGDLSWDELVTGAELCNQL